MANEFNPDHFLLYYTNNFLASPEGREVIEQSFSHSPEIKNQVLQRIAFHEQAMKKMSLNDEEPITGKAVTIPHQVKNPTKPL